MIISGKTTLRLKISVAEGSKGVTTNGLIVIKLVQGPWHQEVHAFGLNYRLPDILCALGVSQLKRLEEFEC